MKKYKAIIMMVICGLFLYGCGANVAYQAEVNEINVEETNGEDVDATVADEGEVNTEEILVEADILVAESIVNSYYAFAKEKQIDQMAALLAEKVIDNSGGMEAVVSVLATRTNLIGDIDSYEIVESSECEFDGVMGIKSFVNVIYESGQEMVEEFVVADGTIIDVVLPEQANTAKIIEDYLSSFGDGDAMVSYLLPVATSNMDLENYYEKAELFDELLGAYIGYEIIEERYEDKTIDNVTCYYIVDTMFVQYENMNLIGHLQIATEDGELGINYEGFYPEISVAFYDEYFLRMQNDDMDAMMDLYSETFYVEMDETTETWQETLAILMGEMSDEVSYQIYDWDYMVMPLSDGTEMPILGFTASVNYNGTVYVERIILNYDGQAYQIQKYELSVAE